MAQYVNQSVSNLDVPNYFADKRTAVPVLFLKALGSDLDDFCACFDQCVPCLKVFTDEIGEDYYKNDKHLIYVNTFTGSTNKIYLTQIGWDGSETDIELTDNTYGTYYDGTAADPKYMAYELDFYEVWSNLGYGKYKIRIESQNAFARALQTVPSPCFEVKKYTDSDAHGTIRIETEQSGLISNGQNYGSTTWSQQLRLPGRLEYSADVQENDDLQLNDNNRSLLQIKDQTFPEYTLQIHLVSAAQVIMPLFDYLFANSVKVSDFNVYNFVINPDDTQATSYRSIPLKRTATDFSPNGKARRKSFNFTMEYAYKNVFKTNN